MTYLKATQLEKLLQPINPARVLTLKKGSTGLSYVAQHDIRAHMNRIFGFGRWSTDVIETAFMFEEQVTTAQGKPAHVACYRATVKVTVHNPDGTYLAH